MDKREMFEAWAMGQFLLAALPTRDGEGYRLIGVDDAWVTWQASWQASRRTTPDREPINPEWLSCETRGPMLRNSLRHRLQELRSTATRCRNAYTKEFMGGPTKWIADVYDEAADVIERHLERLKTAPTSDKGGA